MVEVIVFPKRCPHCGAVMLKSTQVFPKNHSYVRCMNDSCPHFTEGATIGKYRYEYNSPRKSKTSWQ